MTSMDVRAELNYADRDPQFQDPDAYDEDEWLKDLQNAVYSLEEAMSWIKEARELHDCQKLREALCAAGKAADLIEELS